ncbi:MAG: SPASM domain-containing protein [Chromatiales bacterium]|nr:SPASM domain-containing protein [Chromatiales bacterium]
MLIGDLRKHSLKEVWDSEALFEHRMAHLQGKRTDNPTCAECGQLSHCMPDNIAPYVNELADKLLASRAELRP